MHLHLHLSKSQRLLLVIGISTTFFIAEISVGFYSHSLALIADAFHYLNDLVGFIVQYVAFRISEKSEYPKELSFGWQRANLLGAFFNGVFLLALGCSIFLQSIERFISLEHVKNPQLVLIISSIGLVLNIISAIFLHEHDHDVNHVVNTVEEDPEANASVPLASSFDKDQQSETQLLNDDSQENKHHLLHHHVKTPLKAGGHHDHDLGMMGVLLHVIGDAINNIGVMIASIVIWKCKTHARYYADPAVSLFIAIMIFISALPLVKKAGAILMNVVPAGVDPEEVKHDLEQVPGVIQIHELHIWRLNQRKSIASAHVVVSSKQLENFQELATVLNECFHAYGIHSATLQPELYEEAYHIDDSATIVSSSGVNAGRIERISCRIGCGSGGSSCETLTCCSV